MACGEIDRGSSVDCEDILLGGTRSTVTVINYDQVDWAASTKTNGRVTALTLLAGAVAYQFTGAPNHVKKSVEILDIEGSYKQFKHNGGWTIYERLQIQKLNIENLARGLFLLIVENKGDDADAIEVLGWDVGLEANAGVIQDAFANGGNYVLTFSTRADEFERQLPASLGTDYEDALSIIESLVGS